MNTYKLENPISVSYLQDNLRDELPRLVLTRELEANLRNRLDTDPVVQNVYKAIKLNAEQVFEESIINESAGYLIQAPDPSLVFCMRP